MGLVLTAADCSWVGVGGISETPTGEGYSCCRTSRLSSPSPPPLRATHNGAEGQLAARGRVFCIISSAIFVVDAMRPAGSAGCLSQRVAPPTCCAGNLTHHCSCTEIPRPARRVLLSSVFVQSRVGVIILQRKREVHAFQRGMNQTSEMESAEPATGKATDPYIVVTI